MEGRSCGRILLSAGAVGGHELADLRFRFRPYAPSVANLLHKGLVVQREHAELPCGDTLRFAEGVNVVNEIGHANAYKLDRPNPSSWIGNTYHKSCGAPKSAAMQTNSFDFDSVLKALDREIARAGVARTNLALAVSKSNKSLLNNIFEGSDIKLSTLTKIADHLGVNVSTLIPWAQRSSQIAVPSAAEIAEMIQHAIDEMGDEASYEDYPQAVASGVHAQLMRYQADARSQGRGEVSAPDTDAPPPKPTRPGARARSRNP